MKRRPLLDIGAPITTGTTTMVVGAVAVKECKRAIVVPTTTGITPTATVAEHAALVPVDQFRSATLWVYQLAC